MSFCELDIYCNIKHCYHLLNYITHSELLSGILYYIRCISLNPLFAHRWH